MQQTSASEQSEKNYFWIR